MDKLIYFLYRHRHPKKRYLDMYALYIILISIVDPRAIKVCFLNIHVLKKDISVIVYS